MNSALDLSSSVCALIPHFECEDWLAGAIESLLDQTRPPNAIVVIDDASHRPPADIVSSYPDVTLLAAEDNGGPYRLVQAVMDRTSFDAYLFQDADDWSSPDRLEVLLGTAAETGAELIGSHEVRVLVDEGDVVGVRYPCDVNAVLDAKPSAFPLLHPTSLVARDLVRRIGGFATGMRFSGDAEFLRRAGHAARVVNADHFGYFRRKRSGSLTTDAATSLRSPARLEVQAVLAERARANAAARERGDEPDLRPWRTGAPPALRHIAGPRLEAAGRRRSRRHRRRARPQAAADGPPLVIVGGPRSGHALLGWALGQHPALRLITDARWLARVAADVAYRADEDAAPVPAGFSETMAATIRSLAGGGRWIAAGTELSSASGALAALFPDAQFVHVVREVDEVAASLLDSPTDGGTYYTADAAYRAWLTAVEAGCDLESALGPERVLRVRYGDIVADPVETLTTCLNFAGLPGHPACLRPIAGLEQAPPGGQRVGGTVAARARTLNRRVMTEDQPAGGDDAARRRLAARLTDAVRAIGGLLVEKVREVVTRATPEGAVIVVVSRGDPRLIDLAGRTGWHYPQVGDGTYAGHHPADSDAAVEHLEALRARGGEYLVFPAAGMWWLSHYDGLRNHLRRYPVVAYQEDGCLVFRLSPRQQLATESPGPADLVVAGMGGRRPRFEAVPR